MTTGSTAQYCIPFPPFAVLLSLPPFLIIQHCNPFSLLLWHSHLYGIICNPLRCSGFSPSQPAPPRTASFPDHVPCCYSTTVVPLILVPASRGSPLPRILRLSPASDPVPRGPQGPAPPRPRLFDSSAGLESKLKIFFLGCT